MKVPFYHRNIDFDEVLFYHAGNFFSREGIGEGAVGQRVAQKVCPEGNDQAHGRVGVVHIPRFGRQQELQ